MLIRPTDETQPMFIQPNDSENGNQQNQRK